MSSTPNEQQETAAAEPSAVKRILPMILAGSVGLFAGGAGGVLVAGPVMAEKAVARAEVVAEEVVARAASGEHGASHGKKGEDGEAIPATVYKVENLVLNPAQSGGTRFLVATLALEVADSTASASMQQRDSEVRDAILRVLGAKTVGQLADMAGRPALKQELRTAVDSVFGGETVSNVYLPQFVIQ